MPTTLQAYELLPDREEFVAPQPLRASVLALAPALVPAILWASGVAPAGIAAAAGGAVLALAGLRSGYAWADARATQLTSERTRHRAARGVRRLIREAELSLSASSTPLDRHAIEQSLFLLRRVDRRLVDLTRPVTAYGVLVVGELVDGGSNPFSWPRVARRLERGAGRTRRVAMSMRGSALN